MNVVSCAMVRFCIVSASLSLGGCSSTGGADGEGPSASGGSGGTSFDGDGGTTALPPSGGSSADASGGSGGGTDGGSLGCQTAPRPPDCPSALPAPGTPCSEFALCRYDSACAPDSCWMETDLALCDGEQWEGLPPIQVRCGDASCEHPERSQPWSGEFYIYLLPQEGTCPSTDVFYGHQGDYRSLTHLWCTVAESSVDACSAAEAVECQGEGVGGTQEAARFEFELSLLSSGDFRGTATLDFESEHEECSSAYRAWAIPR